MFYTNKNGSYIGYFENKKLKNYLHFINPSRGISYKGTSVVADERFRPSTPEEIELIRAAFPGKFKTNKIELW